VSQSVLDLTHDLAATLREQAQLKTPHTHPCAAARQGEGGMARVSQRRK
jgi:hypothetical protein